MLTHHNLVANMCQMEGLDYFTENDTLICVLPLFHIYGLVVVLNMGLYQGATIVTMPRFELEPFLQAAAGLRRDSGASRAADRAGAQQDIRWSTITICRN